jgi:hypothetical protein
MTMLKRAGSSTVGIVDETLEDGSNVAGVEFVRMRIRYRIYALLPDPKSSEFTQTPTGRWARSEKAAREEYEQAVRSRWRSLLLVVKAKLVGIEDQIETFEQSFFAHMITDSGKTLFQMVQPQLEEAYKTGGE